MMIFCRSKYLVNLTMIFVKTPSISLTVGGVDAQKSTGSFLSKNFRQMNVFLIIACRIGHVSKTEISHSGFGFLRLVIEGKC
jgi:hypothetical protein